jgi:parallel beta-helix repeat protein
VAPTLYVSATTGIDTGSCRLSAHPCLTIGYAISQAPTAASIQVAAGTYAEQVVDSAMQNLSIIGAGSSMTTIDPTSVPVSDTDTDSSTPQYAIVDAQPGSTVNLSGLTIDGSGASNQFTGCSDDYVGVYYHDANGTMSNVIVQNVVLPPGEFGCQDGLAIYAAADTSKTTRVTMSDVQVTNYDKNAITCDDLGTTCTITGSTVTGPGCISTTAQNGIQGYEAASVSLTNDTVTGNCYTGPSYISTGILFYDDASSTATTVMANSNDVGIYDIYDGSGPSASALSITHSTASDATFENMLGGVGIAVDSAKSGTIENDTTSSDQGDGMALYGVAHMTVSTNKAKTDYNGIYIGGPGSAVPNSTHNAVSSNKVSGESVDGIYADTDTSGNTFSSNTGKNDLDYSFQDFSTGSKTAGTANTWTTNHCTPSGDSSPEGLC